MIALHEAKNTVHLLSTNHCLSMNYLPYEIINHIKANRMRYSHLLLCLALIFCFASCYSVRFQVEHGQPEPADNEREDAYAGLNVHTLDTIITRQISTGEHFFNISDCPSQALHTVEYKVSLGGILLNAITFGRKKRVKIHYVCIKENSM